MEISIRGFLCGLYESCLSVIHLRDIDRRVHRQLEKQSAEKRRRLAAASSNVSITAAERRGMQLRACEKPAQGLARRLFRCVLVNGGILGLSAVIFYLLLMPLLRALAVQFEHPDESFVLLYVLPALQWLFEAVWLMPLMFLLEVVNIFWFKDIADAVYNVTHGKVAPISAGQFGFVLADRLFGLATAFLFLIQAHLVHQIPLPFVGQVLYTLHLALLYALYVFEYRWLYQGVAFSARITHIESQWPYFLGFGLPMALLTSLSTSHAISVSFLSVVFPFYITSAQQAQSYKLYRSCQMKVFRPSISLSNLLLRRLLRRLSTKEKL